jgi:hypothetical protein
MKKIFYILAAILVVAILVFLVFWLKKDKVSDNLGDSPLNIVGTEVIVPEFMTQTEKSDLGLSGDLKIQVINRNSSGGVMSYKVIRSDGDIITNRKQLRIRE